MLGQKCRIMRQIYTITISRWRGGKDGSVQLPNMISSEWKREEERSAHRGTHTAIPQEKLASADITSQIDGMLISCIHPVCLFTSSMYAPYVPVFWMVTSDIWIVRWWLAGEQGPNKDGKNDERTSAKLKNSESETDRGGTLRSVSPRAGSQIDKKVTFDASKTTMKILSPLSVAKRSSILLVVWEPWGAWANKKRIKKWQTKSTGQTESYKFMTWKGRKGGVTKQSNEVTSNE